MLDALNHIKDKVDGTLTYRWSCRMGICGSCGMMVNGEPKLTCATFLSAYGNDATVRVEPLRYFPVVRDLVTALSDFLVKLQKVKPWLIRKRRAAAQRGRISADAGATRPLQAVQHVHQLHVVLLRRVRWWGWTRTFVGPAALALAQRYNLDNRDQGAAERLATAGASGRHLGMHVCRGVHAGVSEACGSGGRDPAVQAQGGAGVGEVVCAAART